MIGLLAGSTLVRLAELSDPMGRSLTLLYAVVIAAAVASGPETGKRLWAGVLMMTIGLLGFRVIADAIGVQHSEFRSQLTAVMALLFGVTGFVKTQTAGGEA